MDENHVLVKVAEGLLKGKRAKTVTGLDYLSFQGIPYAKPPIGKLRFQAPQPPAPWEGIRDAQKEGSPSISIDLFNLPNIIGSEDCLYLNIYTPEVPSTKVCKLPVMFHIHGGGFVMCNGNLQFCGPDFLIPEGVILVSINYRLGILGFLSTEDEVCPGNWGLKDQQAALRWVNNNISNFGGDPKNITIFGISAGGASVHYHMLSPLSKGLFQRAISQSGVCLNPWAITTKARERAFRLGEVLGKKTQNSRELIDFLRTVDPIELVSKMNDARSEEDKKKIFDFGFVPCIESDIEGAFLPGNPIDMLMNDKTHDVPLIIGSTSAEGLAILSFTGIDTLNEQLNEYLKGPINSHEFSIRLKSEDIAKVNSELLKLYLSQVESTADKMKYFVEILGDIAFCEGITSVLRNLVTSPQRKAPTYQYYFTSEETPQLLSAYRPDGVKGANHGAEMSLLFTTFCEHNIDPNSREEKLRKIIIRLWTDFAKYGDPTPSKNDVVGLRWDPHTKDNTSYLEINLPLKTGKDLRKEKMEFWLKRLPPCSIPRP